MPDYSRKGVGSLNIYSAKIAAADSAAHHLHYNLIAAAFGKRRFLIPQIAYTV